MKLDLKNAYRTIPVHPEDHHLLSVTWEGNTYIDRALPFGLRSAPKIFSAVADMIAWALHCAGIQHQIHYLDDFLFMGAPNSEQGHKHWRLHSVCLSIWASHWPNKKQRVHHPAYRFWGFSLIPRLSSFDYRAIKLNVFGPCCSHGVRRKHAHERS